jgi:hypothetical protein
MRDHDGFGSESSAAEFATLKQPISYLFFFIPQRRQQKACHPVGSLLRPKDLTL